MLHTTPESLQEMLPAIDSAAGLAITADARIDNRDELIRDLRLQEQPGLADSELILAAYRRWGEGCVDHLVGDFAFAIWDRRAGRLFVARDPLGCKPFYYAVSAGRFVFASSADAVAAVTGAAMSEGRIADYLSMELEPAPAEITWYEGVSRLPPAHCAWFEGGRLRLRRYWELTPADLSHLRSDEHILEAFTEVYTEAVRVRLRSHQPPATMLSGGLDSSTITALARDLMREEGAALLRTYSAVSPAGIKCNETAAIDAVIDAGGLDPVRISLDDVGRFSSALSRQESLFEDGFDSAGIVLSLLFSAAAESGRVLLTGIDGERAIGAPTHYLTLLLRDNRWSQAWSEAQAFSKHYWRGSYSGCGLFLRALRSRCVPGFLRPARQMLASACDYRSMLREQAIDPGYAGSVGLWPRYAAYERDNRLDYRAGLAEWHRWAIQSPALTVGLERYERLASYAGVEARHPLLDIRLLQFSNALPLAQKVRGGWSKYLLRRATETRLPASVAWREGWEHLGWRFTESRARRVLADERDCDAWMSPLAGRVAAGQLAEYRRGIIREADSELVLACWRHRALGDFLNGRV
jgi:asparagine synthase (glutamine-hydrolysing)